MYIAVVALTMLILPLASIALAYFNDPSTSLLVLSGSWFVFWGVGARLGLAGLRQIFQPEFTAREIFHSDSPDLLLVVRELGIANLAIAVVALLSFARPDFVLPVAIYAGIFYAIAGVRHAIERGKSRNESIAMVSDLWLAGVLIWFVGTTMLGS